MENTICPKCKSKEVVKRGNFSTQAHGKRQRYFCKDCKKKFIRNDGFYRMRNSPNKITLCLDLFFKGVSTRKIQDHLNAFYPHNSSHKSIYKWVVKYAQIIHKFTDSLKLSVGSEVQFDEVEYERRISPTQKRGTQTNYFIDSIDTETRFMVASNYAKTRNGREIKQVMKLIKEKTDNQIKTVTTDGLNVYGKIIKNVFWSY